MTMVVRHGGTDTQTGAPRPRIGFVMEQALGHVAYAMNLRAALAGRQDFEPVWLEVPYARTGIGRLPVVGQNWTLRGSIRARRLIARAHRQQPLDALFIHTQTISLFAGGFMRRIPTLLSLDATPRNIDALAAAYDHRVGHPMMERLKRALLMRVWRDAQAYTTWSAWAKASLVQDYGVAASRVTVVHPGVNVSAFPLRDEGARQGGRRTRLLFVGGDLRRKGGDLLLETYRRHLSDACELHLVTGADVPSGDGVYVHRGLAPYSPELLQLYRDADIFVLPTRGDCLAVVLGEAMASSLPIVTTRVGGHAEAVADGESGFLIDAGDGAALRDRLQRLAGDPALRLRMGRAARAIGEARFNMATGASTLADLLVRLGRGDAGREAVTAAADRPVQDGVT
ncbi:MAG: glycosyltransferase family 4 protein [Chloroflexota bacterium]|nr:glycosyltransferase family 4 protein [Chloroflexota bacterium]